MTKFMNLRQKIFYTEESKDTNNVYKILLIVCILHFSIMTFQNFTQSTVELETVNIDEMFQTALWLLEQNQILMKKISALAKAQRVRTMEAYSLTHGVMSTIMKTTEIVDRVVDSVDESKTVEEIPVCKGKEKRLDRNLVNAKNAVSNITEVLKAEIDTFFKMREIGVQVDAGRDTPVFNAAVRQVNFNVPLTPQALFRRVVGMLRKLTDHRITLKRLGAEFHLHLRMALNPTVCPEKKTLFCDFRQDDVTTTVHKIVYCLTLALSTGRVLRLVPDWPLRSCVESGAYRHSTLVSFNSTVDPFAVLSDLTTRNSAIATDVDANASQFPVFSWPFTRVLENRILGRVQLYHRQPVPWVIGHMASYVISPLISKDRLSKEEKRIDFRRPIVGVYVSPYENSSRHLGMYVASAEKFYRDFYSGLTLMDRRILLVSGSVGTYQEAGVAYASRLTFLQPKSADGGLKTPPLTDVYDMLLLARCHFLVCNMSWPPCRLTYEFMQTIHTDADNRVHRMGGTWTFD